MPDQEPDDPQQDTDNDGLPDEIDDDIDGDGIDNQIDDDDDGDGIPDDDIDSDGIPDEYDNDIDGDGIPNDEDNDIDGDGIPNDEDDTPYGDGYTDYPIDTEPDVSDTDDDFFLGLPMTMWGTIFGVAIVLLMFIVPTLISQNFRHPVPKEVNILSGLVGVIGCTIFGLFELWVIFIFALLISAFVIAKVKRII